jgi:hypothetical protein
MPSQDASRQRPNKPRARSKVWGWDCQLLVVLELESEPGLDSVLDPELEAPLAPPVLLVQPIDPATGNRQAVATANAQTMLRKLINRSPPRFDT